MCILAAFFPVPGAVKRSQISTAGAPEEKWVFRILIDKQSLFQFLIVIVLTILHTETRPDEHIDC